VLNLAANYSKEPTPDMLARDAATRWCSDLLGAVLNKIVPNVGVVGITLRAQPGGRQSNYSPVPWVRIYSKQFSPTAMEGNYLVYLFAADGSRAYLSLNQGTSEFRSGAMRPINNRNILRTRAAEARNFLIGRVESSAVMYGSIAMDLSWQSLNSVGLESKRRIRNYEDGNIIAHEYRSGSIPSDSVLMEHITGMIPLLAELYGADIRNNFLSHPQPVATESSDAGVRISAIQRMQGRQLDSAMRRAIELYAEDQACFYFESKGWTVQRVGHLRRGYDLECLDSEDKSLHVEVKGTSTLGEEVILTPNEVRHVERVELCEAQHALFVVSEIRVSRENEDLRCSGGVINCQFPWIFDRTALTPTQYAYRVPGSVVE
jgi:hypothetical protein